MTREEAIAIRARQLQGGFVHAEVLAEALLILRRPQLADDAPTADRRERKSEYGERRDRGKVRKDSAPRKVLELLKDAPKSRPDVRKAVPGAAQTVLSYMVKRGWIKATVMLTLTDDGREALE